MPRVIFCIKPMIVWLRRLRTATSATRTRSILVTIILRGRLRWTGCIDASMLCFDAKQDFVAGCVAGLSPRSVMFTPTPERANLKLDTL